MRRNLNQRRLGVERLETRALLAGDVTASVDSDGLLTVTGDALDNRVYIRQIPRSNPNDPWSGASFSIEDPWAPPAEGLTTINGQSAVIVEGVKNVNVAMGDGRDFLYVSNPKGQNSLASLPGTVNIDMGENAPESSGAPEVLVLYVINHQAMNIALGKGDDLFGISGRMCQLSVIGDPAFVNGDPPGPDDLQFDIKATGRVTIDTGYGDDHVAGRIETANAKSVLTINTGSGNDTIETVITGQSAETLQGNVWINTGDGDDQVRLHNVNAHANVNVYSGSGNDYVRLSGVATTGTLNIFLGDGDDELQSTSTNSAAAVVFDGGNNTDTLDLRDPNNFGTQDISGFEIVV